MYNDKKQEELIIVDPKIMARDNELLNILAQMIRNFENTVETTEGVWFNQSALVMLINAFMLSKFRQSCDPKLRFFNAINQALNTANRKSIIKPEELNLSIDDKPIDFLLKAAKVEFSDDYNEDQLYADYTESYNTYGTSVFKIKKRSNGKHIIKVVPFAHIIWDQNDAENHPMGEVFNISLQDLRDRDMFEADKVTMLSRKVEQKSGRSMDARRAKIKLFEIHGQLPASLFDENESGLTQAMFIVAETEYEDRIVMYAGRETTHPYYIDRRQTVFNRSMGRGIAEELLDSQITTNEIGNLILDQLRATSKIVYQTEDTELDGQDLQEIDNLTLISHEEGSPITQVSTHPTSYSALSSFMDSVISLGRAQSSIQDASLGIGPKSNTSFASIQAAGKEADGQYIYFKQKMFRFIKKLYKMEGGLIDIMVGYFDSNKDIESLLSPMQARSFKRYIATKKAEAIVRQQIESEYLYVDDIDEVSQFVLKDIAGKRFKIEIDEEIDPTYIRDKARLTLNTEGDIINTKIRALEATLQIVQRNPEAFPSQDPDKILSEILELQDIASAYSIGGTQVSQTSQIDITPTGPTVAADAGLA